MPRNYKIARKISKIKLKDAAETLGISQPALSSWESARSSPSVDALEKMADLYHVTTDYLLGRTGAAAASEKSISPQLASFMNGQPVWSPSYGWALVKSDTKQLLLADATLIPISDAGKLYIAPNLFTMPKYPTEEPLPKTALNDKDAVWLEPISSDIHLREELRGWYKILGEYAENQNGNRFSLSSYGVKWLAFQYAPSDSN